MKLFIPIFLILLSAGLFFLYIDPLYQDEIKPLKEKINQQNSVLENSEKLLAKKDEITKKFNNIDPKDIERLEKILPDTIDNVRLIIDLEGIANKYGIILEGLSLNGDNNVNSSSEEAKKSINDLGDESYGSITVGFNFISSYEVFLLFLKDLEQSLRLMDVVNMSVNNSESGLYNFELTIKTYWLK